MRIIFTITLIVTLIVGSLAGLGVFAYSRYVENTKVMDFLKISFFSDSFSLEELQGNLQSNVDNLDQEYLEQVPQYIEGVDSIDEFQNLNQQKLQQLQVDTEGLESFSQEYFQEHFDSIEEVFQRLEEEQELSQEEKSATNSKSSKDDTQALSEENTSK